MGKHGWEHYDLQKEMSGTNTAGLLALFTRETERYNQKGAELVKVFNSSDKELVATTEQECTHIQEGRELIAMAIAESLTDPTK